MADLTVLIRLHKHELDEKRRTLAELYSAMALLEREQRDPAAEGRVAKGPNGSIDDLVIDCRSGRASWAVVSVGICGSRHPPRSAIAASSCTARLIVASSDGSDLLPRRNMRPAD